MRRLYPTLPGGWVSAPVEHGNNHQGIGTDAKIDRERKATRDCTSNIAEYDRIALWCGRSTRNGLLDLADEFFAETSCSLRIPGGRILKLTLRSAPENDAARHRLKRDRAAALTSSQGTTSSGNESSSATRRSNSARCSSVRGKTFASAQMVAHISSTRASRSSTLSRSIPRVLTETGMVTSLQSANLARACSRRHVGYSY